jgi:endonuclease/exonuclease/phosphatase (EEP) superfamily protein YafD
MLERATRGLLIGAALLYCVSIVALWLLWATQAERIWWLALSNVFALFLFVPLLLLAPAALLVRSRWLRGAAALSLVVFLALFGARLVPRLGLPADGAALRVMTLNQMYANERVDALIAAIRAQDADIVAVQELSLPMSEAIRRQLLVEYPYQALMPAEFDAGLGLLSRHPLQAVTRGQGFPGQRAIVEVGGQPIALINVHLNAPRVRMRRQQRAQSARPALYYDTSRRARELPALLRAIDAVEGPLVVMGDFNTGDREPPYAALAARLHDAYAETAWGFGLTFPTTPVLADVPVAFPLVRIDYVWSKGGVAAAAARVICQSGGSDHCAVVAELRLSTAEALKEAKMITAPLKR